MSPPAPRKVLIPAAVLFVGTTAVIVALIVVGTFTREMLAHRACHVAPYSSCVLGALDGVPIYLRDVAPLMSAPLAYTEWPVDDALGRYTESRLLQEREKREGVSSGSVAPPTREAVKQWQKELSPGSDEAQPPSLTVDLFVYPATDMKTVDQGLFSTQKSSMSQRFEHLAKHYKTYRHLRLTDMGPFNDIVSNKSTPGLVHTECWAGEAGEANTCYALRVVAVGPAPPRPTFAEARTSLMSVEAHDAQCILINKERLRHTLYVNGVVVDRLNVALRQDPIRWLQQHQPTPKS